MWDIWTMDINLGSSVIHVEQLIRVAGIPGLILGQAIRFYANFPFPTTFGAVPTPGTDILTPAIDIP